jgi:hypothetical protein
MNTTLNRETAKNVKIAAKGEIACLLSLPKTGRLLDTPFRPPYFPKSVRVHPDYWKGKLL